MNLLIFMFVFFVVVGTFIVENLVPCVFLELFFVLQLLTSWSLSTSEPTEMCPSVCERKTGYCCTHVSQPFLNSLSTFLFI